MALPLLEASFDLKMCAMGVYPAEVKLVMVVIVPKIGRPFEPAIFGTVLPITVWFPL